MKKKNKKIVLMVGVFILTFIMLSCNKSKPQYYYMNFSEKDLKSLIITGELIDNKENGLWSFYDGEDKKLLSKGNYKSSLKVGDWNYSCLKDSNFSINWTVNENNKNHLVLNYPDDWQIFEQPSTLFCATFKTNSNIKDTKYFFIVSQSMDSLGLNLEQYLVQSQKELSNLCKINTIKGYKIKNDNKDYYFQVYSVTKNSENLIIMDFICVLDKNIIEFVYSSLNENEEMKKILLSDIVKGCYINGKRIVDPLKPIDIKVLKQ